MFEFQVKVEVPRDGFFVRVETPSQVKQGLIAIDLFVCLHPYVKTW
jgi:hypothetical protein